MCVCYAWARRQKWGFFLTATCLLHLDIFLHHQIIFIIQKVYHFVDLKKGKKHYCTKIINIVGIIKIWRKTGFSLNKRMVTKKRMGNTKSIISNSNLSTSSGPPLYVVCSTEDTSAKATIYVSRFVRNTTWQESSYQPLEQLLEHSKM